MILISLYFYFVDYFGSLKIKGFSYNKQFLVRDVAIRFVDIVQFLDTFCVNTTNEKTPEIQTVGSRARRLPQNTEHGTCVPVKTINGSQYSVLRSAVIRMYFAVRVQRSSVIRMYFAELVQRSAVIGMYFAERVQRSAVIGMYFAEQCSAFCGVPSMYTKTLYSAPRS